MCSNDTYIMTHTVLIIENLIQCPALWELLKGSPLVARLLALSKSSAATGETKSKIIRIVTNLSKDTPPEALPQNIPKRSKYEDVNIRLYSNPSDDRQYNNGSRQNHSRSSHTKQNLEHKSYSFEQENKKSSQMENRNRENLRNVGYDAIHPGSRGGRPHDYNQMEEKNQNQYGGQRREEKPMRSHTDKMSKNMFDNDPKFDNNYDFPLEGGARRDPIVKIPFNDNLLNDY